MLYFFGNPESAVIAVQSNQKLTESNMKKLVWLFGNAPLIHATSIKHYFIGPRVEMITPWSTNAVEICQNMSVEHIVRIEEFKRTDRNNPVFDPMLQRIYPELDEHIFDINRLPEQIIEVEDIQAYNMKEGLALSQDEVEYLESLSKKMGRLLTDSEVFGFSQVNSEHCRHKIFNGTFVLNGQTMQESLFAMIKKTSKTNPNRIVSAYSDNVAFIQGPIIDQFAPGKNDEPDFFTLRPIESVISLKAETHNFPTTVEPFNGAATGTGGEIRDRMAGGKGSMPLVGTAVYMTSYPRTEPGRSWENFTEPRPWLYKNPAEILIKASNGASDFGNKFGQPLICGSLLTFEHDAGQRYFGYDKVIMLAGGVGYGAKKDSQKALPEPGDVVIVMGGDNYRIGMGGGAVSSVATGEFSNLIELNAVQRSNPEMQKRVSNVLRALAEMDINPVISVHDHGAGGHLNALSELIESTGGMIDLSKLPIGDSTLSFKEIAGNESQERMGLLVKKEDLDLIQKIAERERAPLYVVGYTTDDHRLVFYDSQTGQKPIDLDIQDMFGNTPKTVLEDLSLEIRFQEPELDVNNLHNYLGQVLMMEAVACKDWLTNKVDRSVTGKVVMQQCAGSLQLPLNNLAVVALDYTGCKGIATSIGHAPVAGLANPEAGSHLSVAEALTNLVWAPIEGGIKGVSLSANWMWPAKNSGENDRLYRAVKAISDFAVSLGVNIPTGKDSLSMKQQYEDKEVLSPGTCIVSTVGEVRDYTKCVGPVLQNDIDSKLIYIDFSGSPFALGGSSFAQCQAKLGNEVPAIPDSSYFAKCFDAVQDLIWKGDILAGHDVSSGGLITCLLEMTFANVEGGMQLDLNSFEEKDIFRLLFSEKPAVVIQLKNESRALEFLSSSGVDYSFIGQPSKGRVIKIDFQGNDYIFNIDELRDKWFKSSYLLDAKQHKEHLALERFNNYKKHGLNFILPAVDEGAYDPSVKERKVKAAIIREKGVNGDREMAFSLWAAGFDVKDVHMTDLINGRENLEDIQMIVFVGGFSNSDVLGSAKGWAGAFLYNSMAKQTLDAFYAREDTLSLGVCNGCQLMVELNLLGMDDQIKPKMMHNDSGKFESAFLTVDIHPGNSVMLKGLENSRLGIWVAHGEGRFSFGSEDRENYQLPIVYSQSEYPGNPNGSVFNAAAICSADGRHLAMMPHLERSIMNWQWAYQPEKKPDGRFSPWFNAFVNARKWLEK
jgi:phosphoribosylformylglycinamidine synthase